MSEKDEMLDIRLRLTGEPKDQFLAIKAAKGLENNTDVLRTLINEYVIPVDLKEEDREFLRQEFCDMADRIRQRYNLTVPETRRALQQMLSVSV
jgi:hypothetical protein